MKQFKDLLEILNRKKLCLKVEIKIETKFAYRNYLMFNHPAGNKKQLVK